ncbi:MAG: hypothetical protein U0520_03395 [Candidatus Saccharimonadales bacterium]
MLAQEVNPRDKETVTKLLDHLTSTDTLSKMVNDHDSELGIDVWSILREVLFVKDEDNIGKINALRLAVGALVYGEDQSTDLHVRTRDTIDFSRRITKTFQEGLRGLRSDLERYIKGSTILGVDEVAAREQFLSGVSVLEIAAAFPMQIEEIAFITGLVKKSSL